MIQWCVLLFEVRWLFLAGTGTQEGEVALPRRARLPLFSMVLRFSRVTSMGTEPEMALEARAENPREPGSKVSRGLQNVEIMVQKSTLQKNLMSSTHVARGPTTPIIFSIPP
jgi:hypothetical protein